MKRLLLLTALTFAILGCVHLALPVPPSKAGDPPFGASKEEIDRYFASRDFYYDGVRRGYWEATLKSKETTEEGMKTVYQYKWRGHITESYYEVIFIDGVMTAYKLVDYPRQERRRYCFPDGMGGTVCP